MLVESQTSTEEEDEAKIKREVQKVEYELSNRSIRPRMSVSASMRLATDFYESLAAPIEHKSGGNFSLEQLQDSIEKSDLGEGGLYSSDDKDGIDNPNRPKSHRSTTISSQGMSNRPSPPSTRRSKRFDQDDVEEGTEQEEET